MPHLFEVANKYRGKVTFLALSDEKVETVEPFLSKKSNIEGKTWGEAMPYSVATDPDLSVKNAIHKAAGEQGIPSTFIISGGKIQWIGHPMSMDKPLAEILAGEWDIEKARKGRSEMIAARAELAKLAAIVKEARKSGNWGPAMSALEGAIEKNPGNPSLQLQKWEMLLLDMTESDEAYTYGEKLVSKNWDNAMLLNQVAWTVVDDQRVKTRDLKFAMRVAERAALLSDHEDGAILDTLARAYYESGQLAQAVEWQRKAVKFSAGEMKAELQKALDKYEAQLGKKKGTVL